MVPLLFGATFVYFVEKCSRPLLNAAANGSVIATAVLQYGYRFEGIGLLSEIMIILVLTWSFVGSWRAIDRHLTGHSCIGRYSARGMLISATAALALQGQQLITPGIVHLRSFFPF